MKQLLKFAVAALAAVAAVLGTYAQPSALTYQLIAIDHENGRAGSAVIDLDETITGINARFINGGQDVMLELARPITHDLTVNCVSVMTGQTVASGVIPAGSENLQLPSSSWPCGTYVLAAIKNGTVAGTVQLLKQ